MTESKTPPWLRIMLEFPATMSSGEILPHLPVKGDLYRYGIRVLLDTGGMGKAHVRALQERFAYPFEPMPKVPSDLKAAGDRIEVLEGCAPPRAVVVSEDGHEEVLALDGANPVTTVGAYLSPKITVVTSGPLGHNVGTIEIPAPAPTDTGRVVSDSVQVGAGALLDRATPTGCESGLDLLIELQKPRVLHQYRVSGLQLRPVSVGDDLGGGVVVAIDRVEGTVTLDPGEPR